MNTALDDLEIKRLLEIVAQREPSWKQNLLPESPATELFHRKAEPRRAMFSWTDQIGDGISGKSGGGSPPQLPTFQAYAGVFQNGTPVQKLVTVVGTVA